jgi:ABC-2 type transport system permease protein
MSNIVWIFIAIAVVARIGYKFMKRNSTPDTISDKPLKKLGPTQRKFYTIWVFFTINMKRLFRDRLALFFTFLFPLIFLFVFGSLFSGNKSVTFNIAIINESKAPFAKQFVTQLEKQNALKVNKTVTTFAEADQRRSRGELDATLELPANFGEAQHNQTYPSGQAIVHYTQNNQSAAQTLTTVLQAEMQSLNARLIKAQVPFTVTSKQNNERSLNQFDYTFTGLLGFAILGAGIFGPINIFPELKKMGILRRLHTTPLRVWQYFLSVMFGNAVSGLMSIAVMFVVAMAVYHLKVVGNYFELTIFLIYSIILILGIGLAIGGWAKNERQAAPLANIVTFPLMFLSGTFFPRYVMPQLLQDITTYLPLSPIIDGARLIATEGEGPTQLGSQLGIMTAWMIIVYFVAFRVFRWE